MTAVFDEGAPALRLDAVTYSYGSTPVIEGVSFEMHSSEAVALLGTNGAGKSTLLRLVAGLERPTGGRVELFGDDVTARSAEERARRGVVLVRGGRGVFADLTVSQNLDLYGRLLAGKRQLDEGRARALSLFPVLVDRLAQPARLLSGGERQQLALARAVVAQPRLLLIDELSLGLAPAALERLIAQVGLLNSGGLPVLLVEQSVRLAASVCARAIFLDRAVVQFDGAASALLRRPGLARTVFFGGPARP
ncbi:MAG TPA: ATP-binding cassette domain-containing protein [Mycobacteriales bacterium]|nr:ATP-binding cassette domain-containing protein [Mycobacteriales bacterium]